MELGYARGREVGEESEAEDWATERRRREKVTVRGEGRDELVSE